MIARSAKKFRSFVSKTGVATATAVQYLMGSCLPHQHYTDWYDGRHISCCTSFPPPPPPIKKLNGSGRFRKVTLKGSGGVRTPGPPRPATGLKESWLFISILTLYFPYCFLEILNCTVKRACLLFLHAFPVCLQHKMHYRRAFRPPVVHFMLQTNRKSVQKK